MLSPEALDKKRQDIVKRGRERQAFLEDGQAELQRMHRLAREPEAIGALIHVIENNQGFHLHKAVEQLKITLSSQRAGEFRYVDGPVFVDRPYLVEHTLVGIGQTKRVESYWTESTITDVGSGIHAATVLLHQGVFKASYAEYPADRL